MHFGGAMFFTDYSMSAPELARALEERGFESVWAPEHSHIPLSRKTPFPGGGEVPKAYYDAMDPFVVLAAASEVTKRIKFGTGVALIQQRDVIQTAKLVASIDQVSQGRFLFGIGGGWNQDEMEDHGTVYATRFSESSFVTRKAQVCIIPPNSFVLSHTVEYFKIPRDILVICLGKSTYARCGLIVNVTPLEPEWEGRVTLEISNTTPLPARVFASEGICQFLFLKADSPCAVSYADRAGKYQGQTGVTLPRMETKIKRRPKARLK
jgi:dCTP deaminase